MAFLLCLLAVSLQAQETRGAILGRVTDTGFERNTSKQLGSNLRTMPSRYSGIRGDGINNSDLSVIKSMQITERVRFQFRTEFINAWNHTQFSPPNTTPSSTGFGTVTSESQYPRTIQFAAKLAF